MVEHAGVRVEDIRAARLVPALLPYIEALGKATRLREYNSMLLPGLLQSEDYCRSLFARYAQVYPTTPEKNAAQLRVRLDRQVILERPNALTAEFVVDEVALRREVAEPRVMAGALRYVVDRLSQLVNIEVRVVPQPNVPFNEVPFSLVTLDGGLTGLYREGDPSSYEEGGRRTQELSAVFPRIQNLALTPQASIERITAIAYDFEAAA